MHQGDRPIILPGWAVVAREHKELWIETSGNNDNTPPAILPVWGGAAPCVICYAGTREGLADAIGRVRYAFDPDALAFINDAYSTSHNPPEVVEELLRLCQETDVCLADLAAKNDQRVKHAIMATYCRRGGETIEGILMPYQAIGKSVIWYNDEIIRTGGAAEIGGGIPDCIRFYMRQIAWAGDVPVVQTFAESCGLDYQGVRKNMARGLLKVLVEEGNWFIPMHADLMDLETAPDARPKADVNFTIGKAPK